MQIRKEKEIKIQSIREEKKKPIFIHRPHYYYFSPFALWTLDQIPETGWLMNHPVVIKITFFPIVLGAEIQDEGAAMGK